MPKLIAIVGPTASGKTALAIEVARHLPEFIFEAVNADSRQVYRGMDIGTAKPTAAELASLPHHVIDLVNPDEAFGLQQWLELANGALEAIWARGGTPILVGGTGQYIWALLEGWRVPEVPPQGEWRREQETRPLEELVAELARIDPASGEYIQPQNVRRVIRALEVYHATGKPFSYWRTKDPPRFNWLAIGLRLSRTALYERIDRRVDAMVAGGLVNEVRSLIDNGYGCDLPAMSGIGYREMCQHLRGEITLDEAVQRTSTGTHRLARHQNSWFKASDERIRWVDAEEPSANETSALIEEWLNAA